MLENQLFDLVKEKYKDHPSRIKHVEGVYNLAKKLGKIYNIPYEKICYSSILHDISKYELEEVQIELINDEGIVNKYPKEIYHAFAGANYVKNVLKINDEDVINAIRYHVFGRRDMSRLEEIIMVSDFAEESRVFKASEVIRNILLEEKDLEKAIYYYYDYNIKYLEERKIKVLKEQYELKEIYKEKICLRK